MPSTVLVQMGTCPIHGLVAVHMMFIPAMPHITTGPLCVVCRIEQEKENGVKLNDVHMVEVSVP